MKVTSRNVQGVEILKPEGRLTIDMGAVVLRGAVMESLSQGKNKILLDLASVTTVDSSGLGELVNSYTTVSNRGGKLMLLNVPQKIQDLLMITRLITVFQLFDNEAEALKSFS